MSLASQTGTITTSSSTVTLQLPLAEPVASTAMVTISGTYAGVSIAFEAQDNASNWYAVEATKMDTGVSESTRTMATNGSQAWVIGVQGFNAVRVRSTAYTSGTANVYLVAGSWPISVNAYGGNQTVTISNVGTAPPGATGTSQTALTGSSSGAAQANNSTLTGAASKYTYISGFAVTGTGATAQSVLDITITGVVTGTMHFALNIPAGATTAITPLVVSFGQPIQSSAVNTNIVVNVPSFGAGNTNAASSAWGFVM